MKTCDSGKQGFHNNKLRTGYVLFLNSFVLGIDCVLVFYSQLYANDVTMPQVVPSLKNSSSKDFYC